MATFQKMKNMLLPPPEWRIPVLLVVGILAGLVLLVMHIGKATSYLSDNPAACVNCHVMAPQFATWQTSSHARVASCNDCHVPQTNILESYFFKAKDGLRHSYMFTFRLEPQVILIKDAGKEAVQQNCIRCHSNTIHPIALRAIREQAISETGERFCWSCHREIPHGRVSSLSSAPYARVPQPGSPVPDWLGKYLKLNKRSN